MADVTSIEFSTEKFNEFLQEFIKSVDVDATTVLKKMAFDLLSKMVYRTPVRYGRARAGWSAAGAALGVHVPTSPESKPGDSFYEEQLTGDVKVIRMVNKVNYIIYLEYGSSQQAPLGMLRVSMAEIQAGKSLDAGFIKEIWNALSMGQRYAAQRESMTNLLTETPIGRLSATLNAVRVARK